MADATLFRDLAVVLIAAGATAALFYYLKQPVVLGYLLAGFLVGPHSPGPSFVGEGEVMGFLGEIGIIFLLFALGLDFNLRKLKKVGLGAVLAAALEVTVMLGVGYGLGRAFGWGQMESLFLGAIVSISSTTIIVKVLEEMGKKDEEWAQMALGILVVEDVLAVLILTGLSSAASTGNFRAEEMVSLLWKLGVFLGAALVIGLLLGRRFVDKIAILKVEEVMVLLAAATGFGMALVASALGFSPGLGAFVAGALMAESPRVVKIEHKISPLRDLFTAIFFVTIGAQLDLGVLSTTWTAVLAVAFAVIVGKILGVTTATFVVGQVPHNSVRIGLAFAQIGEFAFVIAALGIGLGVASPVLLPVAIAVSAGTAFLTPYLIRASPWVVGRLAHASPAWVRAYATSYGAWVTRLRRSDRKDPEWTAARRAIVVATLCGAVVISIFFLGAVGMDAFEATVKAAVPRAVGVRIVGWLGVGLAAAPFAYVWYRSASRAVAALARLAVPARLRAAGETTTEKMLRRTFGFIATVGTGLFVIALGSLIVPSVLPVLIVVGIGVVASTASLGRTLSKFHVEVEETLARVMDDEGAHESKEDALALLNGARAWGAGSREVTLPEVSGGAGRTIGDLRLRELTGASVARVHRAGAPVVVVSNPGPELKFGAGDRILLLGESASLLRAEEILLGQELGIAGGATEVIVSPGSALVGATLGQANLLKETGADVLLVRRGGAPQSVDSALVLAAGDVLVVSGTDAQVERVRARASVLERDEAAGASPF